jgi:uncharacterized protein (TIGR03083 family)
MDIARHIDALHREGQMLADAAARIDLDTPIPTCPEWTLRDLVRHIGGVHRWAAWNVAHPSPDPVPEEQEKRLMDSWPGDDRLLGWFREGHAALVETLRSAPPDVACWSFLPAPSPLAFWARRQAHETAIHRADAESPSGAMAAVSPEFGADGLDELLLRFGARRRTLQVATPAAIHAHAVDSGDDWLIRTGPDGFATTREAATAVDCSVRGTASDLYLFFWNRVTRDALDVVGDPAPLDLWRESVRVRWS